MKKIMSNWSFKTKLIVYSIVFVIVWLFIGFLSLPAFKIYNFYLFFYYFVLISYILVIIIYLLKDKFLSKDNKLEKTTFKGIKFKKTYRGYQMKFEELPIKEKYRFSRICFRVFCLTMSCVLLFGLVLKIAGSKLFCAKIYANQLEIQEGTKEEFHNEFKYNSEDVLLPIIDKELAFKLAQSKLSTYGAQYSIDIDNFTIISVHRNGKDELVRVTPLEYSGFFVALNRMNQGSVGYIEVNVVTKEAKLVEVEGGMKYLPSALLFKDLDRHVRLKYPTAMFNRKYFEIDDTGKPFWVIPTYTNRIALFSGQNPTGVITVDPVTGDTKRYSLELHNEPKWIDRVVVDSLVQTQATNALKYKNGFINATFGQKKEVFQVSDGYNYFIKNGQTYYVSCITSPNENDQTSVGFITINLKTKAAKTYFIPGITEMRAREIAMQHEEVKAQKLEATWPILIDYNEVPTYFMVLKNDVQVMRYVFVNVENGLKIVLEASLDEAKKEYEKLLTTPNGDEVLEVTGTINRVRYDNENVYFTLNELNDKYFTCPANLNLDTMFLQPNDQVKITYIEFSSYYYVQDLSLI